MEEYRIDMKIRNNLILSKIESLGYKSVYDFCKNADISYGALIKFANMKKSIFATNGKIRPFVHKLCETLKVIPEEIFSATQMETCLKDNKKTIKVNEAEAIYLMNNADNQKLLEDQMMDEKRDQVIDQVLFCLTPRERKVIEMRMGLGEYTTPLTLEECGKIFDVTRVRVRQIEDNALRKMRHPSISEKLREFINHE